MIAGQTGLAVTGGLWRALLEALGPLPPPAAVVIVVALCLAVVVPVLLGAHNRWSTTRRLTRKITSEDAALSALEILQAAPTRRAARKRVPQTPAGPVGGDPAPPATEPSPAPR